MSYHYLSSSGSHSLLSQFIWKPFSTDILASLPPYCLTGQHIWCYRGSMICVFIVEAHVTDRVARQFGMLQAIPRDVVYTTTHHKMTMKGNSVINWAVSHQGNIDIWDARLNNIFQSELTDGDGTTPDYLDWYLQRTVRLISRVGALNVYLGGLLKTIADRTQSDLPDVSLLATEGLTQLDHRSLYGFEAFSLEDRRNREMEGRQDPGHRPKRGGRGGRGGGRPPRRRVDQLVPDPPVPGDEHDAFVDGGGHVDVPEVPTIIPNPHVIGDDHDALVDGGGHSDIPEPPTTIPDPPVILLEKTRQTSTNWYPSFDLGLTPTPHQSTDHSTGQHPPAIQPADWPSHEPISSHPTFDLETSSQSTQTSLPLTQASDSSPSVNPSQSNRADNITRVYQPRRSKRPRKPTKCGTDGEKCVKHNCWSCSPSMHRTEGHNV